MIKDYLCRHNIILEMGDGSYLHRKKLLIKRNEELENEIIVLENRIEDNIADLSKEITIPRGFARRRFMRNYINILAELNINSMVDLNDAENDETKLSQIKEKIKRFKETQFNNDKKEIDNNINSKKEEINNNKSELKNLNIIINNINNTINNKLKNRLIYIINFFWKDIIKYISLQNLESVNEKELEFIQIFNRNKYSKYYDKREIINFINNIKLKSKIKNYTTIICNKFVEYLETNKSEDEIKNIINKMQRHNMVGGQINNIMYPFLMNI